LLRKLKSLQNKYKSRLRHFQLKVIVYTYWKENALERQCELKSEKYMTFNR
jgi:hypothetical protein